MSIDGYDLFISYSSLDRAMASELNDVLVDAGFDVWFDQIRLEPGINWRNEIEAGRDSSRIVLPVVTPQWAASEWCRYETYGGEHCVPLLFDGEWNDAPQPLHALQFVDLRQRSDEAYSSLVDRLRKRLANLKSRGPKRLDHLPFRANPVFVGRESMIVQIHERLAPNVEGAESSQAVLTSGTVQALAGLGGVGKTTLAREYAELFWHNFDDVLWVTAEPEQIIGEMSKLALHLGLIQQPTNDAVNDAQRAFRELCSSKSRLLILDNAPDEESIRQWIPTVGGCRVLITSRFDAWSTQVASLPVEVLDEESAIQLLVQSTHLDVERDEEQLRRVAQMLGCLPLALEHTAALIREMRLSLDRWFRMFEEARPRVLSYSSLGAGNAQHPVAKTWTMTVDRLGETARAILRVLAFLAPREIPRRLIEEHLGKILKEDEWSMSAALAELQSYSMIRLTEEQVLVHRLVQLVQREEMSEEEQIAEVTHGLDCLTSALADVEDVMQCPFIESFFDHLGQFAQWHGALPPETTANLLGSHGLYLRLRGRFAEAESIHQQTIEIYQRCLGKDHPLYAKSLNNLARLYVEQGRYEEAESLFQQALEIHRALGGDHPDFVTSLRDLAGLSKKQGHSEKTESLYLQIAENHLRISGKDHPDYANSLNDLATFYRNQGRYEEAESLFQKALEICRRVLGKDHPDFTTSLSNLANLYRCQGRFEEAERLYQQVLEIQRHLIGKELPDYYGGNLINLARLKIGHGRYEEAEAHIQQALEVTRRMLGEEHPDCASTLNSLALFYRTQGRYEEAEPLFQQTLEIRRQALGEEHPDFASSVNNLALLYMKQERYEEAEPLYQQALEILRRVLGEEHPEFATTVHNIGELRENQSREEEAFQLYQQAAEIYARTLGNEHPRTKIAIRNCQRLEQKLNRES